MRRTALKRKPFKRKRPSTKHRANDEPSYRLYVRTHRCCACGAWPTDPAHTDALGRAGSGTGQKTDDRSCIPLCRPCHDAFDFGKRSKKLFAADHGLDIPAIVAKLNTEYEQQRAA